MYIRAFIVYINCVDFKLKPNMINLSDHKIQSQNNMTRAKHDFHSGPYFIWNCWKKKTRADYSNISSMINVREYLNYQNNFNKVAFVASK